MDAREAALVRRAISAANGEYVLDRDEAHLAMDEYFTERALELLEYMAKNEITCVNSVSGKSFYYKGEWIDKESLFENIL